MPLLSGGAVTAELALVSLGLTVCRDVYVVRPTATLDLDTWHTDDHSHVLLGINPGQMPCTYFAGVAK
jgi:hypothetical protein